MLAGENVNLRIMEKDDLPLFAEWVNNPEFMGEFVPLRQETRTDLGRTYDSPKDARVWFVAEKKDGTKIGYIAHFLSAGEVELGYFIVPNERRKGYVSEAIKIMIDYLFLSKDIVRIQARADPENLASCKALEKAEFTREGILRKTCYCMGQWRDDCMYSILREEWKEPKIPARTT